MKKKNGFSLIELMAIIILLGIIALIVIPSVDEYISESENSAYDATLAEIIKASKNWNQKYGHTVVFEEKENNIKTYKLKLTQLKETEYLDNVDLIDPRNDNEMDGCVIISKYENNSYKYEYQDNC